MEIIKQHVALNRTKVLEAAQKYLSKGQHDKAIAEYQKLVKEDPRDVRTLLKLLESTGATTRREGGGVHLRADAISNPEAPYDLVRTMRASVLVLGPLVARAGVESTAVLERFGDGFREVAGLVDGESGESLAHIGYVPVAPVLQAFDVSRTFAGATARFAADPQLQVMPPSAVEVAARELWQRGWLTAADAAARR